MPGLPSPNDPQYSSDGGGEEFLGVPEGFTGRVMPAEGPPAPGPMGPQADTGNIVPQPPQSPQAVVGAPVWKEGDQSAVLSMSPEKIKELQQALAEVGLLEGPYRLGLADDPTMNAYRALLGWANRLGTGRNLNATLQQLAIAPPGGEDGGDTFEPEPYLAPNYESLSTSIRDMMERELGREPDEYEVQQLAEVFGGFDRMAHEREQELAQIRAQQAQGADVPMPDEAPPDPSVMFRNRFEELYSGELDFIEDKQSAVEQRQAVQSGADLVSRAARGGR